MLTDHVQFCNSNRLSIAMCIICGIHFISATCFLLGVAFFTNISMCIFWLKGASTSQVIGARNEMMMDDYDGQMIFGDLMGLSFLTFVLQVRKNPEKTSPRKLTRGSNPGPLCDKRSCYHLFHTNISVTYNTVSKFLRNDAAMISC